MKTIILLMAISSATFASAASIECSPVDGTVYSISTGDDTSTEKFDNFWYYCQDYLHDGAVCFNGKRSEVIDLLSFLDNEDILGDEYSMQDIHYSGRAGVAYDVFDGPNDWISQENTIVRCD